MFSTPDPLLCDRFLLLKKYRLVTYKSVASVFDISSTTLSNFVNQKTQSTQGSKVLRKYFVSNPNITYDNDSTYIPQFITHAPSLGVLQKRIWHLLNSNQLSINTLTKQIGVSKKKLTEWLSLPLGSQSSIFPASIASNLDPTPAQLYEWMNCQVMYKWNNFDEIEPSIQDKTITQSVNPKSSISESLDTLVLKKHIQTSNSQARLAQLMENLSTSEDIPTHSSNSSSNSTITDDLSTMTLNDDPFFKVKPKHLFDIPITWFFQMDNDGENAIFHTIYELPPVDKKNLQIEEGENSEQGKIVSHFVNEHQLFLAYRPLLLRELYYNIQSDMDNIKPDLCFYSQMTHPIQPKGSFASLQLCYNSINPSLIIGGHLVVLFCVEKSLKNGEIGFDTPKPKSLGIVAKITGHNPIDKVISFRIYHRFSSQFHESNWYLGVSTVSSTVLERSIIATDQILFPSPTLVGKLQTRFRWLHALCRPRSTKNALFDKRVLDLAPKVVEKEFSNSLNSSQFEALVKSLGLSNGFLLIQGPPGTGKTTTIINILSALAKFTTQRVLIIAPTNKALAECISRFESTNSTTAAVFLANSLINKHIDGDKSLLNIFKMTQLHEINLTNIIQEMYTTLQKSCFPSFNRLFQYISKHSPALCTFFPKLTHRFQLIASVRTKTFHNFKDLAEINANQVKMVRNALVSNIKPLLSFLRQTTERISDVKYKSFTIQSIINASRLFFTTATVAGRKVCQKLNPFDLMICDESSQMIEPELFIPFNWALPERIILVGDPNQLPATISDPFCESMGLGTSTMSRMMDCGYPYILLNQQYRMHPDICRWPSVQFYQSHLKDSVYVINRSLPDYMKTIQSSHLTPSENQPLRVSTTPFLSFQKPPFFFKPIAFYNTDSMPQQDSGNSYCNKLEAQLIFRLVLLYISSKALPHGKIGILSFYSGQIRYFHKLFSADSPFVPSIISPKLIDSYAEKVSINTVDGFQGGEHDILFISFVRNGSSVGFLKDFRRLNVALTRARHEMYCFGSVSTLKQNEYLESFLKYLENKSCIVNVVPDV